MIMVLLSVMVWLLTLRSVVNVVWCVVNGVRAQLCMVSTYFYLSTTYVATEIMCSTKYLRIRVGTIGT